MQTQILIIFLFFLDKFQPPCRVRRLPRLQQAGPRIAAQGKTGRLGSPALQGEERGDDFEAGG